MTKAKLKPKVKKPPSIPSLLKKLEVVFNRYIRLRDQGKPCISCSSGTPNQAGHYFSVKVSSYARFMEMNVHNQCPGCNLFKRGNVQAYRQGLIHRYGKDQVEAFEAEVLANLVKKWDRQEILSQIELYKAKIAKLEGIQD